MLQTAKLSLVTRATANGTLQAKRAPRNLRVSQVTQVLNQHTLAHDCQRKFHDHLRSQQPTYKVIYFLFIKKLSVILITVVFEEDGQTTLCSIGSISFISYFLFLIIFSLFQAFRLRGAARGARYAGVAAREDWEIGEKTPVKLI